MENLILFLYPFSWLVALASFTPQIIRLMRTKSAANDISLVSWSMFQCNAILGWSYTVLVVGDPMLMVTSSLVLTANVLMLGTLIYKRTKYREPRQPVMVNWLLSEALY
ncbi:hypothetical protein [Aliagarivorans taiwanensis]|uniref:hypothetical protein n=1 Tax=Aliagarivorans taiwanensis TaxID=561966 RepID=UPI000410F82D|nr:hypothetical protein [Aliagarivorans taiwanensis]